MVRLLTIACIIAVSSYCYGDDPPAQSDSDKYAMLLKRIDELERRIAVLEGRPGSQLSVAPRTTLAPNGGVFHAPIPPNPGPHATNPPMNGPTRQPAQPPRESVPQGWQQFNFNGQWFYIIPIENAQNADAFRVR